MKSPKQIVFSRVQVVLCNLFAVMLMVIGFTEITAASGVEMLSPEQITEQFLFYDKLLPHDTQSIGLITSMSVKVASDEAVAKMEMKEGSDIDILATYWTGRLTNSDFADQAQGINLSPESMRLLAKIIDKATEQRLMAHDANLVRNHPGFSAEERRRLLKKAAPLRRQFHIYSLSRALLLNAAHQNSPDWQMLRTFIIKDARAHAPAISLELQKEHELLHSMSRSIFQGKHISGMAGELAKLQSMVESARAQLIIALFSVKNPGLAALNLPETEAYAKILARFATTVVRLFASPEIRQSERNAYLLNTTYSIRDSARWAMAWSKGGDTFFRLTILTDISNELVAAARWMNSNVGDNMNHVLRMRALEIALAIDPLRIRSALALARLFYEGDMYDDVVRLYDRIRGIDAKRITPGDYIRYVASLAVLGEFKRARKISLQALGNNIGISEIKKGLVDYLIYTTFVIEGKDRAEEIYKAYRGTQKTYGEVFDISSYLSCRLADAAIDHKFILGGLYNRSYCYATSPSEIIDKNAAPSSTWQALVLLYKSMAIRPGPSDRALELTKQGFALLDRVDIESLATSVAQVGLWDDQLADGRRLLQEAKDAFGQARQASPWWPTAYYNYALVASVVGGVTVPPWYMGHYLEIEPDLTSPTAQHARSLIRQWKKDWETYNAARK